MDTLLSLDVWLFRLGNQSAANPLFDILLPFLTNEKYFIIPYTVALLLLVWKGGRKGRVCVAIAVLAFALIDQCNSQIFKEAVGRLRPCHTLEHVRLLVHCGGGKSFPSSHAANTFGAAVIFSFFYRRALPYLFLYASTIAYTRVYCGVHYPSDVLGGAMVGSVFAILLLVVWELVWKNNRYLALPYSPQAVFFRKTSPPQ